MERPATWKVVTVGVALAGFSVASAGAAQADRGSPETAPTSVGAANDLNAPLDPIGFTPWIPTPGKWIPTPGKWIPTPGNWIPTPGKCLKTPWKCVPGW
jgi:hypothetical protein